MRSNIFSLSLSSLLRPALVTGILLFIYLLVTLSLYPLLLRFPDLVDWINTSLDRSSLYLLQVNSVENPIGYLNFTGFSLLLPLALSLFAVFAGQGLLNAAESRASIELLLARPVERSRLVLEKFTALALILFLICTGIWGAAAWRSSPSSLWIDPWRLAQGMLGITLLTLLYASLGLAAASLLRSSAASRLVSLALVALPFAFYFLEGMPGNTGTLKYFSPFYYAVGTNTLAAGLAPGPVAVLAGLTAACLVLAMTAFERRDL